MTDYTLAWEERHKVRCLTQENSLLLLKLWRHTYRHTHIYTYKYLYTQIYIYIYLERERKIDRERLNKFTPLGVVILPKEP